MTLPARHAHPPVTLQLVAALLGAIGLFLAPATAEARRTRISVQPMDGDGSARVRAQVVRACRSRGLRVHTDLPAATGTGQYYTWARELGLAAFITGEVHTVGRRQRATFLVWSGHTGGIVGRWSVTAPPDRLPQAVARGLWPRLRKAFMKAKTPPEWRDLPPGPTMRINAGAAYDGDITGSHYSGRPGVRRRTR